MNENFDPGIELVQLRERIDTIDQAIADLLEKRIQSAVEIGRIKSLKGLPVHHPKREAAVMARVQDMFCTSTFPAAVAEKIFSELIAACRAAQEPLAGHDKRPTTSTLPLPQDDKPVSQPLYLIVGMGLLGGSIALALRRAQPECRIHLYGRNAERLKQACAEGYADGWSTTFLTLPRDIRGAFVCTPVESIAEIVCQLLELTGDEAFITDVGSNKSAIVREVSQRARFAERFIGSHPMAGSEKSGYQNSKDDLFLRATVVLTPLETTRSSVLKTVHKLWTSFGSRVVTMLPEEHDSVVGLTSHLPHLISFCYTATLAQQQHADFQRVWGNGLRDMVRLAGSDPLLWSGIMTDNRLALLQALEALISQLDKGKDLLKRADRQGLADYFRLCRIQLEELCVHDR